MPFRPVKKTVVDWIRAKGLNPRAFVIGILGTLGLAGGVAAAVAVGVSNAPLATTAATVFVMPRPTAPAPMQSALAWSRLTPTERTTLAPLQGRWQALNARARSRWIRVAAHLQGKSPRAVARAQAHMTAWQLLSPAARQEAREHYETAMKLSAQERARRWHFYQARSTVHPTTATSS